MLSRDGFKQGQLANTASNIIQKQVDINEDVLSSQKYAKFSQVGQSFIKLLTKTPSRVSEFVLFCGWVRFRCCLMVSLSCSGLIGID